MNMRYSVNPESSGDDDTFDWDFMLTDEDDDMLDLLLPSDLSVETHLAMDKLFDAGCTWEEGIRLLTLREHYFELPETRERLAEDGHLGFARWLYQHGVMTS